MAFLIAIGGLSGSGKTSLALSLADKIPNSVHFDSDRTRKEIFGVPLTERLPPEAYSPEATGKLIAETERRVKEALAAGKTVILSAAFYPPQDRARQEQLAAECGADFMGIWLDVDVATLLDRVAKRVNDVSDATGKIVEMQAKVDTGPINWAVIDARQPREAVAAIALSLIQKETAERAPRRHS